MTIQEKQAVVINDLNSQIDWPAKITRIIAYGSDLPAYPTDPEFNSERFVLRAADCSTRTFFLVGRSGQNQYIRAKSNAAIPLGLAGLVHYIYNGQPLNDVADFTPTFIADCGLDTHLTLGQINLLRVMLKQIYDFIHDVPMPDEPTPQEEINRLAIVALQQRATTDEGLIAENADAIASEITARETADETLQTNIDNEAETRQTADTTLQTNINNEVSARENADTTLQTNIDNEKASRQTADATLQTNIDNEEAARQTADNNLQSNINAVANNLSDEIQARETADEALQTNIDNEEAARQNADSALQSNINSVSSELEGEVSARQTADATLLTKIESETSSRQTADENLQIGLNNEKLRAQAAEQANTSAIATEKTRAEGAERDITILTTTNKENIANDEKIAATAMANIDGRLRAIEEGIAKGFANITVDNLFVKAGMRAYMFNGDADDDALIVIRDYAPNFIPKSYVQRWFDTGAKKWYKPQGLSSVSDWVVDDYASLLASLTAEILRAQTAEQANATAIATESQRAINAEGVISTSVNAAQSAITSEAQRAQAAEGAINTIATENKSDLTKIDAIVATAIANIEVRLKAIEQNIMNGFANITVDNLFVKAGMRAYMFNGDADDDALTVVRDYAPNFIPKNYAQRWFDTSTKKWYKPQGLSSVADWVIDN